MISVALKTPLQIRLGIGIHKTSLLRFHTQLFPHILQQNCAETEILRDRDPRPSKPRPRLQKTGLETKSRDSITGGEFL